MKLLICFLLLFCVSSCQKKSLSEIKIAASSVPHAEILEFLKPEMKKQGFFLNIIVVDDYQLPNRLLDEKQIDANFFQHEPFLQKEITDFGYKIKTLVKVHSEPLGIYSKKIYNLEHLPEKAKITIPSDPTNELRALRLLEKAHVIKLREDADQYATILDIVENPYGVKIQEIDAPLLTRALADVDLAVIPGNFVLQAGLNDLKSLLLEEENFSYINVLAIRRDEEERKELQLIADLLKGAKVRQFIRDKYQGKIIPLSDYE